VIRDIKPEDHAFIYATWLRQLWFSKDNNTLLPKDTFMRVQHKRIEDKLSKGGKIVCPPDDTNLIYGYTVDGYTYIKKAFRNIGLEEILKESQ